MTVERVRRAIIRPARCGNILRTKDVGAEVVEAGDMTIHEAGPEATR
jgi:hypothetical protein